MLYPDAQKQAQAQLDKVIDDGRMPGPSDLEKLPYVRQIMKETLRCENSLELFLITTFWKS